MFDNMDGLWASYAKWNKLVTGKQMLNDSIYKKDFK